MMLRDALCCKTGAEYEQYYVAKEEGRNYRYSYIVNL